jgi:enoyl-CoA hydratase
MPGLVEYELHGSVGVVVMDDAKMNVMSPQMLAELNTAFDRAADEAKAVLLTGRPGVFSAGFDLPLLREGDAEALAMVRAGFALAERVLSFPRPVVAACTGHAVAMGAFLLLSCDYRVGVTGEYRLAANEVAIGLTMPHAGLEILRQRLTPAAFNRASILAETFSPQAAVAAGFLDQVVEAEELSHIARETAESMAALDTDAHAATKLRAREQALAALRLARQADHAALRREA